jgi:Flp pilus assembly protein TadG
MTTAAATRRNRGLRGSEGGATAVEAALVLSVFVGMVLTIVDFAQAFFIWNTLQRVVGQASRDVIVQNGIPFPGSSCDAACATSALQTAIRLDLGATASICTTPTAGQYCVNATCNPISCSSPTSTPATMTLSASYGFSFVGTYTLAGQITVPIGLPPD